MFFLQFLCVKKLFSKSLLNSKLMSLENITSSASRATREGFGQGLLELGRQNPNVVGLTADLMESLQMQHFQKEFPERFFQIGIAEANMMGIAAGLATAVARR